MASNVTTQRRTERALETIALSVSAATGSEVFDLIVKSLASALEVGIHRPGHRDRAAHAAGTECLVPWQTGGAASLPGRRHALR